MYEFGKELHYKKAGSARTPWEWQSTATPAKPLKLICGFIIIIIIIYYFIIIIAWQCCAFSISNTFHRIQELHQRALLACWHLARVWNYHISTLEQQMCEMYIAQPTSRQFLRKNLHTHECVYVGHHAFPNQPPYH